MRAAKEALVMTLDSIGRGSPHNARLRAGLIAGVVAMLTACASSGPETQIATAEERSDRQRRAIMHYDMGVQQLQDGNSPLAIRELLMATKYNPDDAPIRLALAEAYRRRGRVEESEQNFLKALELNPEFQRARVSLSAFYSSQARFSEARDHAKILVNDPTFSAPWVAHTNLGWAQYKLGDTNAARENLRVAVDYRNDYWPARLNLGILEAGEHHHSEALTQFRQVLAVQPGPHAEAETHYRIAELQLEQGNRERAILHLTESANRKPSGAWGQRSSEALQRLN